jgi:hypothetical protein
MSNTEAESHPLVCSFDPTVRGLAYVVMEGPQKVLDWGVAEARFNKRRRCLQAAGELIEFYEPDVVVLEDPRGEGSRRCARAARLIRDIADYARTENIRPYSYPRNAVRELFERFGAHTKHEIATSIAEWLPELKPSLPRKRKPWMTEDDRMNVFDAVSFALTYYYFED